MGRSVVRYSEAFKRQVVDELERGKFATICEVNKAYGIRGNETVSNWIRQYGRIRQLEAALADAHIDCNLENSYLRIACERIGVDVAEFKKKNDLTLSELRKRQARLK